MIIVLYVIFMIAGRYKNRIELYHIYSENTIEFNKMLGQFVLIFSKNALWAGEASIEFLLEVFPKCQEKCLYLILKLLSL